PRRRRRRCVRSLLGNQRKRIQVARGEPASPVRHRTGRQGPSGGRSDGRLTSPVYSGLVGCFLPAHISFRGAHSIWILSEAQRVSYSGAYAPQRFLCSVIASAAQSLAATSACLAARSPSPPRRV